MPLNSPQPRLVILAAPSGAGKTTLCDMLLKQFPNTVLSISTTTRSPRPHEKNGVHYFFVTPEEFERKIAKGEFAEWAWVHNHRYGTSKETIERHLLEGKHILFDIDVQGAKTLQAQYGPRTLLVFIRPPSMQELEARLIRRKGDSAEAISTRLENAKREVAASHEFDYNIVNDHLETAFKRLAEIFRKECR